MSNNDSAQSRIASLQAEIEELKGTAIQELRQRRKVLQLQLEEIDAELGGHTSKPAEGKPTRRRRKARVEPRVVDLAELKDLLAAAPHKTLNVRQEGLELRQLKKLVQENSGTLKLGGKGAWPTVTLLK